MGFRKFALVMDIALFDFLYSFAHRSPLLDAFIVFFASTVPFLLGLLFLLVSFFAFSNWRKRVFIFLGLLFSGVVSRGILVPLIRFFYHRPRPFQVFDIEGLLTPSSFSFPSGHAAFFFALSAFLFFFARRWGVFVLALSFLVSVSRVVSGAHFPSDILGGMVLGALTAFFVFRIFPSASLFPTNSGVEDQSR